MDSHTPAHPVVLPAEGVGALPEERIGSRPGVTHRVLWRNTGSMAGVMTIQGGHRLGAHTHEVNHHHLWVLEGEVRILGQHLGPGSYVHVPSGIEHDLDATETGGCTVHYLYLAPGSS